MRHDRRGFILLFGTKNVVAADPAARVPADARCPRCGRAGSLAGRRLRPWFTLFFVPVFPMGGGRRFTGCRHCGAQFVLPPERFATAAARADAEQVRRSIALYNRMRYSRFNSVSLHELLTLYNAAGEHAQAVQAAADFPDAVDASEQCMVAVGNAHLGLGDPAAAVGWYDRAIARDADAGDAHVQRAMALLRLDPPDRSGAIASARAARRAEYPGADGLLREIEAQARED